VIFYCQQLLKLELRQPVDSHSRYDFAVVRSVTHISAGYELRSPRQWLEYHLPRQLPLQSYGLFR